MQSVIEQAADPVNPPAKLSIMPHGVVNDETAVAFAEVAKIKAVAIKVRLTNCMGVRIGREIVSLALKLKELHIKPTLSA